mgnify:FL=1|tara:strand:- start:367 stop:663 length:297 start_codon:yes stop_codon:yes gene_type:complete
MASYKNHLKMGSNLVTHKNKEVATSIKSLEFEKAIAKLNSLPSRVGNIPPGFEHRADRIADLFYGSPTMDWIVLWTNNISDPFQQLNAGDRIRIVDLV